ncbi:ENHANCER OF AG-4 protein 2-like protein [Drosera capensis]
MATTRKSGTSKGVKTSEKELSLGDLVLAKVKGFPAWPAKVSKPENWERTPDPRNTTWASLRRRVAEGQRKRSCDCGMAGLLVPSSEMANGLDVATKSNGHTDGDRSNLKKSGPLDLDKLAFDENKRSDKRSVLVKPKHVDSVNHSSRLVALKNGESNASASFATAKMQNNTDASSSLLSPSPPLSPENHQMHRSCDCFLSISILQSIKLALSSSLQCCFHTSDTVIGTNLNSLLRRLRGISGTIDEEAMESGDGVWGLGFGVWG